jgi:hypothetical protein
VTRRQSGREAEPCGPIKKLVDELEICTARSGTPSDGPSGVPLQPGLNEVSERVHSGQVDSGPAQDDYIPCH